MMGDWREKKMGIQRSSAEWSSVDLQMLIEMRLHLDVFSYSHLDICHKIIRKSDYAWGWEMYYKLLFLKSKYD